VKRMRTRQAAQREWEHALAPAPAPSPTPVPAKRLRAKARRDNEEQEGNMIDFEQILRAAVPEMLPRGDKVVEHVAQTENGDDDVIDLCPYRQYPHVLL